MADADFGIRGEATLDTSSAEKSATGLSDKLGDALDKSGQKMSLFASLGKKAADGLTVAIGNFETKIAQAAVQAVQQVVSTGLEFNRQMENYQLAFENLLGSAEAANAALDAIKADAASTPFDVAGLVSANRLLISTGQSAEEARQVINALGNAVSASGGGNAELERMAANLQQIANVGKASAVDIRQFAYAGIDIYGILADYTGLAKNEVQGLTISYDLLVEALKAASAEGGRYAGAMEAYSQTLQGRMDTLADNATQLAGALTEGLFEAQKGLVEAASGWVETLQTTLEAEGPAAMLAAGVNILFEFLQGVAVALPNVVSAAVQTVAQFLQGIVQNLPALLASGGQIVGTLIEGILSSLPDLASCAGGLASTIIETLFTTDWLSVGWQIVSGIGSGLLSGLASVGQSILDWASGVAQGVADTLTFKLTPEEMDTNPYHKGSVKDDNYWKQVGEHFKATGQDQRNGNYTVTTQQAAGATFDLDKYLQGLGETGKTTGTALKGTAEQVETLADKITKADKALTESQNAYQTLTDAVQEYSEKGAISLSTWQDLMDLTPEYQVLLSKQGDQLVIDTAAYNELTAAQRLEIETLVTQNGVTAEAIQLIDSLGLAAEETADKAGTAFSELKDKIQELVQGGPLEVILDLADALRSGDWASVAASVAEGLWLTITPEQQDIIYNWAAEAVKTLNDGFAKAGWSGLADAGATVLQGLMDSGTDMGGLITGLLNQVGISGGIQGLLSTIAELAPLVLGVAASAAAVAAGVVGVAAAFKYVISQSQLLQDKVQELTDAGRTLTDELTAALEVLQPVIDLSEEMLANLDRLTSTITDTLTGIGVELMESLLPVLTEIMDTLAPVAESLQPALEAAGDLLRTVLELFGTLASSALTALQPVLEAVGPLLETLALRLNTIATLVSNFLSPVLKVLGEVLNWLLQPILWVADAIQAAVTFVVDLLNSVLGFLGLKTIDLPDGSAALKGEAFDKVTNALEDNTEAIQEQTDLIRNPPRYQTGGGGSTTGVTDYSAMLAAARAAVLAQNTKTVTNYDAGSGQTTARLNASWRGTSTTVLELDGKEIARATAPYMDEELAF